MIIGRTLDARASRALGAFGTPLLYSGAAVALGMLVPRIEARFFPDLVAPISASSSASTTASGAPSTTPTTARTRSRRTARGSACRGTDARSRERNRAETVTYLPVTSGRAPLGPS